MNSPGIKNPKIVNIKAVSGPSQLEKDYISLYGKKFVEDLKYACRLMKHEIKMQPPLDEIIEKRVITPHEIGERVSVFFVDFRHEDFLSMTIDEFGHKTLTNYGDSPCLKTENDDNLRYLISGILVYNQSRARYWLEELIGEGEKCRAEAI